jgi:hypothetical protein
VLKDFHVNSLHQPIPPLIIRLGEKEDYGSALVRTEPGKTKEALASLEKVCNANQELKRGLASRNSEW